MSEEPQEKPSKAERMIARGDAMQKAGDSVTKAGNSMMATGCLVFIVLILALVWWAVAC